MILINQIQAITEIEVTKCYTKNSPTKKSIYYVCTIIFDKLFVEVEMNEQQYNALCSTHNIVKTSSLEQNFGIEPETISKCQEILAKIYQIKKDKAQDILSVNEAAGEFFFME